MKLIYLAAPYWDPDPEIRLARIKAAGRTAWQFTNAGVGVVSPLSHSAGIRSQLRDGWEVSEEYWRDLGLELVRRCDEMWVLMLPGWRESKGLAGEFETAKIKGIPVYYIKPEPPDHDGA